MLGAPFRRCGHIKNINYGAIPINANIGHIIDGLAVRMNYSKDKGKDVCCQDIVQTAGKKTEPWPKSDPPPPAWRCECPREPQPPNYDPYRIKVPDVVVPPLPPSNARWTGALLTSNYPHGQDPHSGQPHHNYQQGPYQSNEGMQSEKEEEASGGGFLGLLKGFLDKIRGKGKGESENMMKDTRHQPMLDCTKLKGPCSVQPAPKPPPCPPPPPKPFPWIYVIALVTFLSTVGVIYKLYLYKELQDKLGVSNPIWRPRRKIKRPYHDQDLPACVQYMIIGAGAAGWAAYRAIMEHDKNAKVFFISKEDCLPYNQLPMSKHMWWNPEPPELKNLNYIEDGKRQTMYLSECRKFMDAVKFYRKKRGPAVSIASGWCVLRVDADDHVAYVRTMCGEQPIYYERCLIAPGSKAKNLSIFKSAPKPVRERVCTLRTIRDLEIAYRKVKEAKHVVIIGAGPLGCELAWHLGKMNQNVERPPDVEPIQFVHMFKDKGILGAVIPEYLGEWAAEKIKCEGVTQMPKTQVYDAFETPDGRLELTLSNGTSLITDYVFVAIGTEPRVEIAEPSFLELDSVNGGFLVNTELEARTHLYVAGDAASFFSQWKQARQRFENYGNAMEQGFVAGANMTGFWVPCNMERHATLQLGLALDVEVVGDVGACMPIVALFKQCSDELSKVAALEETGGGEKPCYKKTVEYQNRYKRGLLFYLRDETVVGFVFWNMPPIEDRKMVATELLRARPHYKDINVLAELLGFPELECVYIPDARHTAPGPCIQRYKEY